MRPLHASFAAPSRPLPSSTHRLSPSNFLLQLLNDARSTCAKEVASTKLHLQVASAALARCNLPPYAFAEPEEQPCCRPQSNPPPPPPPLPAFSALNNLQEYNSLLNQVAAKEASVALLRKAAAAPEERE